MKNNEANKQLSQVHRLEQKLDEFKRMQNEEFYKVKRDEVKVRKQLDDIKLKYQRAEDSLNKLYHKEEEINELRDYFQEQKDEENRKRIEEQLQYEKDKHSLLGLIRHKNKTAILWLIEYLELPEINIISILNKNYRSALWNESTFIWKAVYRNVNLDHFEAKKELQRQIDLKTHQLKTIVPARDFAPKDYIENEEEVDFEKLLQTYIVDNTRVGECIQNTMFNTKTFLNKQFTNMQKIFQEEQEKLKKEREEANNKKNEPQTQSKGLFGNLFSKIRGKDKLKEVEKKDEESKENKEEHKQNDDNYLLSTNQGKPVEEANLLDLDDDPKPENNTEKEVPMKMEDDDESHRSEAETYNETVEDPDSFGNQRARSDSIKSTSTTRMYSYKDLNDFVNIEELHKFMYKCGAVLVSQPGNQVTEWIEWMQRSLAEYYVHWQVLYKQAKDVEILKDFLSQKLQITKFKLDQTTNEKEDLLAHQEAEAGIKEYLAKQMQELNIKHIEKTHELVMVKQKLSEAIGEVDDVRNEYESKYWEAEKYQIKLAKEWKALKKHVRLMELENKEYKEIFEEMEDYVGRLRKTKTS